jgi:hypothetical protein
MSKQIDRYIKANPEKFESWHTEDNNERGLDYWVYCREPYYCPATECGTIHEDTVAQVLAKLRTVRPGVFNGYCWEDE